MPLYDYRCGTCGTFEVEQKITEHMLKTCPTCGGYVKRLIAPAGIVFKGSGFYVTDSRKDKPTEAATAPAKTTTSTKTATPSTTQSTAKSTEGTKP